MNGYKLRDACILRFLVLWGGWQRRSPWRSGQGRPEGLPGVMAGAGWAPVPKAPCQPLSAPPTRLPLQADYFSCVGTVVYLRKENCMYQACPSQDCNKKVIDEHNGLFRCEKCDREFPNFKYRMILSVSPGLRRPLPGGLPRQRAAGPWGGRESGGGREGQWSGVQPGVPGGVPSSALRGDTPPSPAEELGAPSAHQRGGPGSGSEGTCFLGTPRGTPS